MSYNHYVTQEALVRLEVKIKQVYDEALKDVSRELRAWNKTFRAKDALMRKNLEDGTITKQYYRDWRTGQLAEGQRWEELKNNISLRALKANELAVAVANEDLPAIYALNASFEVYTAELMADASFSLINDSTLIDLFNDKNHSEFRTLRVNPTRDYNWNYNAIQKAMMQGIIAGDSIDDLTLRFYKVMENNMSSARRNARTAYISAQNGGIAHADKVIHSYGYEIEKVWLSTIDIRTRESHRRLHGVKVPMNDYFPNGLKYPCDPNGFPSEVYNCRCTYVRHIVGVNDDILNDLPHSEQAMDLIYSRNPKYLKLTAKMTDEEKRAFKLSFVNNDKDGYTEWLEENADPRIVADMRKRGLI